VLPTLRKARSVRAVAFQSDKRMLLRICFKRTVRYVSGVDNLAAVQITDDKYRQINKLLNLL